MADPNLPVGTEIRTAHGAIFEKLGPNEWRRLGAWGKLDDWGVYFDSDVEGTVRW